MIRLLMWFGVSCLDKFRDWKNMKDKDKSNDSTSFTPSLAQLHLSSQHPFLPRRSLPTSQQTNNLSSLTCSFEFSFFFGCSIPLSLSVPFFCALLKIYTAFSLTLLLRNRVESTNARVEHTRLIYNKKRKQLFKSISTLPTLMLRQV